MMRALVKMTLVIAVGHALAAACYWWLLHTPESTLYMLLVSALALLLGVALVALTAGTALQWQRDETRLIRAVGRSARVLPAFLVALIVLTGLVLLTRRGELWWSAHRGEIEAWFIATFGLPDIAWVHRGFAALMQFVRWVVGLSLVASLLATGAYEGLRGLGSIRWLTGGCGPRQLLFVLAVLAGFVWLPWRAIEWRPVGLPPNWIELAFLGAKLAMVYVLLSVAWALILLIAARRQERTP